jgi:exopolysaccharide biosynthesis protein
MQRFFLFAVLIASVAYGASRWQAHGARAWHQVAPGVEISESWVEGGGFWGGKVHIVALRAAPSRIHIATGGFLRVNDWRRRTKAIAAVNGGFFDESNHALGLRVSRGRKKAALHPANWGVFFVRAGRASIVHTRDFKMRKDILEAVQCGPRLVVDGKPTDLKAQWARRTGIGVGRDGRVVIAVADGELSLRDWAALWAKPTGFNCRTALNHDGGPSTQLSMKAPRRSLEITGPNHVTDAVVIQ